MKNDKKTKEYVMVKKLIIEYVGKYKHTDDIMFDIIADEKTVRIYADCWEDLIPVCAFLHEKVKKHEEYDMIFEVNACSYQKYEVCNMDNDIVRLMVWVGSLKVYCDYKRPNLLKVLKRPLLAAVKDKKYFDVKFNPEEWDINNNQEDKKYYEEYMKMLLEQVIPESIAKEIKDYNLACPDNVMYRGRSIPK